MKRIDNRLLVGSESSKSRTDRIILSLAKKVRELEAQMAQSRVTAVARTKFQVIALLMRQERSRIRLDSGISESSRLEVLRRLDGIAAIMVRVAAKEPGLIALLDPNAPVSAAAQHYRRSWLMEMGFEVEPEDLVVPVQAPAPSPTTKQADPPSVEAFHRARPFKAPQLANPPEFTPARRLVNWELLGPIFKALSHGGSPVSKSLPDPPEFLDRLTPNELRMMPHQAGVVEAARAGHRNFLLADEPGLGKTAQALLAAAATDSFPLLVVAPNVVKVNWARESALWLPSRKTAIISGSGEDLDAFADVFIINYDILDRHLAWMKNFGFAGMVLDEAHFIKNFSSQRSANVLSLASALREQRSNPLMLALTGTPVINSVEDFRAIWHFLGWLTGPKGQQPSPALISTLEDSGFLPIDPGFAPAVRQALGKLGIVRRRKVDVAKDLPRQRVADLPVEVDDERSRSVKRAEKDLANLLFSHYVRLRKESPELDENMLKSRAVAIVAGQSRSNDSTSVFTLLRTLGLSKVALAVDFTFQILESVDKVVFFAKHVEVMDEAERLFAGLGIKTVSARGNQTAIERQAAIDAFSQDSEVRVIICSLLAAGVGLNLQAASNVVLAELSWTAAEQQQAIDRVHRIGQTQPVVAWRILAAQTLDVRVAELIDAKAQEAALALDGDGGTGEEVNLQTQALASLLEARIAAS